VWEIVWLPKAIGFEVSFDFYQTHTIVRDFEARFFPSDGSSLFGGSSFFLSPLIYPNP
jgi:hypothetical protein